MSLVGNIAANYDKQSKQELSYPPPTDRHSDTDTLIPVPEGNNDEGIKQLARTMSRRSAMPVAGDPLNPEADGIFDPHGSNFDAQAWAKAIIGLQRESDVPARSSGVAFENLSQPSVPCLVIDPLASSSIIPSSLHPGVHGFGSDADYQTSVGNTPLKAWGALKGLISNEKHKIQILNELDGLIDSGDMVVVLGPPGRSV
jgi:ATP-binding cassette subfamily G (WHITE) protein 2 (PDR)